MAQQKILLALLNSNGDCLYGTVIARQIKEVDYKGCHLTWAINSRCKQTILHNPYVDSIWEIPTEKSISHPDEWAAFVQLAEQRKAAGDFDIVFYLQIIGKSLMLLDGNVRSSLYRNYPHPVTVPQQPIVQLSSEEIKHADDFAALHNLNQFKQVVLVECGPDSFASALNPASAYELARSFADKNPGIAFILSSNKKVEHPTQQVIDGSTVSFRENAALTKYCTLFIGCSSGISWLCTSTAAKELPMILLLNSKSILNTSMVDDHLIARLPVGNIIELNEAVHPIEVVANCIQKVLDEGFDAARNVYHQPFRHTNFRYFYYASKVAIEEGNYGYPAAAFRKAIKKNGFHFNALYNLLKVYIKLPGIVLKRKFGGK